MYKAIFAMLPSNKGCNLRCSYCSINTSFSNTSLPVSTEELVASINRDAPIIFIGNCYGETTLSPVYESLFDILDNETNLLGFTSNSSRKGQYDNLKLIGDKARRLYYCSACHYFELKNRDLLDTYIENIKILRDIGAAYTCLLIADDNTINNLQEISDWFSINLNIKPHIIPDFRGNPPAINRELVNTNLFDKLSHGNWGTCKAGQSVVWSDLDSGSTYPCNAMKVRTTGLFDGTPFTPGTISCNTKYCCLYYFFGNSMIEEARNFSEMNCYENHNEWNVQLS